MSSVSLSLYVCVCVMKDVISIHTLNRIIWMATILRIQKLFAPFFLFNCNPFEWMNVVPKWLCCCFFLFYLKLMMLKFDAQKTITTLYYSLVFFSVYVMVCFVVVVWRNLCNSNFLKFELHKFCVYVCVCVVDKYSEHPNNNEKKLFLLIFVNLVRNRFQNSLTHTHTHSDFLNKSRFQFFWMTFFHHYPFSILTTYNNNNKDFIFGHLMSINNCDRQREKEKKSTIQMIMCVFVGG